MYVLYVMCTSVCMVVSTNTNLTKTQEDVVFGGGSDLASVELVMYVCRSSFLYFPKSFHGPKYLASSGYPF